MTYTISEFEEKYNKGFFKLDLKGHFEPQWLDDDIKRYIESIKRFQALLDNKEPHHKAVYLQFEVGKPFQALIGDSLRYDCSNKCGERYSMGLINKDTISLFKVTYDEAYNSSHEIANDCEYMKCNPITSILNFEDEVIFSNFFNSPDSPEDKKYSPEYSLQTLKGRENITEYKASKNIAYGQMSNMSLSIYVNKDKTKFVITDSHLEDPLDYYDKGSDEYNRALRTSEYLDGYNELGEICLDVWRWEATDRKTYDSIKGDERLLKCDIPSGQWRLTHNFDTGVDMGMDIYSTLELI